MSTPILPLAVWQAGTNQNSIPANDNALRIELLNREIISQAVTAQPASPVDGDTYIIAATHTGAQWSGFTPKDLVIYKSGTWYAFAPVEGLVVNVAGTLYKYDASVWDAVGGGSSSRTPAVQSVVSASTVTPTFSDDLVKVTAQAAALTLANPSGTAIDGIGIVIRIKDNGTARTIAYGTQYRAIGLTLPNTTVLSKTLYLAGIWNVEDTKLDIVAVAQE